MDAKTADVLVDIAPHITVFREDGKWFWKGKPTTTLEDVLRELAFQEKRLGMKADLIRQALEGLRTQQS